MANQEVQIINTGCPHDCGGKCVLKAHVREGVILRITSDDGEEPQLRACQRGRAYRQRVYAPDRLKYPLKRVGERGRGEFQQIGWDEALDTVAREMVRIKNTYGPQAILRFSGPGSLSLLHSTPRGLARLLNMFGGCTTLRGGMSAQGALEATLYTYGVSLAANDIEDVLNSKLIILWSWNSAETINGTNTNWYLVQAKEKGVRIICIDPRFTDTAALLADQWVPIVPGTDAALMIAMAYVMIQDNLQDQGFLDTYTRGFEKFKDYVLGMEDGVPKTPAWAEDITGVPRALIESLAREYATTKPAALLAGLGMQRTAYGEQSFRASITLAAMTGSIGVHGGSPAGHWTGRVRMGSFPTETNLVEKTIPTNKWADALLQGTAGGYESDIKMVYAVGSNFLVQRPNINKGCEALMRPEFIVVQDQFMTPTAKFADILLPITTSMERNDICTIYMMGHYALYLNKAIERMYDCKSDLEVFTELAERLEISDFNEKTEEEWLKDFVAESEVPDYQEFKRKGLYHIERPEPYVAFKRQIEDPIQNSFRTPSGKIEIYSQRLADMNHPQIPPIPKYIEPWEGRRDPLAAKYPLQLLTTHGKRTALSVYANIPWIQEIEPHTVWINPQDARSRGIGDGDKVKVFNDRGTTLLQAKVTQRIMPGVVSIDHGLWYDPDEKGVDRGGSVNVLARDEDTLLGDGATTHSCLVQVQGT